MSGAAIKQVRRPMTARELGERFGRSPRTVRRVIAEPRDDYEARSRQRQMEALALREQGLTYQVIADRLGISRGAAAGLVHRARQKANPAA